MKQDTHDVRVNMVVGTKYMDVNLLASLTILGSGHPKITIFLGWLSPLKTETVTRSQFHRQKMFFQGKAMTLVQLLFPNKSKLIYHPKSQRIS